MNHVIIMPVWQLLCLVVGVSIGTSIPTSYFAARRGGRNAIQWCSQHNDCAMTVRRERAQDTADLEKQYATWRAAHPEVGAAREAMAKVDSGPVERTRAVEDKDREGHT